MHDLTIEQRESLQTALKTRADALRDAIAHALDPERVGRHALANHREETDDDAIIDLETSLEVDSLERNTLELREVGKALLRIHTPEFGECTKCTGDIPFARLQANPLATRCTGCQRAHERAHPSSGRHTP